MKNVFRSEALPGLIRGERYGMRSLFLRIKIIMNRDKFIGYASLAWGKSISRLLI